MSLTSGTKLGPYEIQSPLGAGGMGEVYRARDTRLDRTVAIKILPTHLSEHAAAKQRFDREARAISSLNHSNICHLYDVGQQDGASYLVMEYLEGETLADRLRKGPLPLNHVLKAGAEICEGLEKAHRSGVVHRDLKPSNIMLTKGGTKLMDFGLAKASLAAVAAGSSSDSLATMSEPLTAEGTIVGTFQYMSPEQVEGREADPRSDIFSLGAILYEMVTGKRAFEGKTTASTIAAILSAEPKPISAIQPMSPPALEHVTKTCLAKDPDERFQTAHDVKVELQWIAQTGSQIGIRKPASHDRGWLHPGWIVSALLLLLLLSGGAAWWRQIRHWERPMYFSSPFPSPANDVAVSPDGRTVALVAYVEQFERYAIWLYEIGNPSATTLPGTDGASHPFWSPDARSIGFFADGKLKRIDVGSGSPQVLCDAPHGRGGTWNRDGVIVFAPDVATGLYHVSSAGGTPAELTKPDVSRFENSHRWPLFLPDGRHFLYLGANFSGEFEKNTIYVGSLDSRQNSRVVAASSNVAYVDPGYLLYLRDNALVAQQFDKNRFTLLGEPHTVTDEVQFFPQIDLGVFGVSGKQTLVVQTGTGADKSQLAWFDRSGRQIGSIGSPGLITNPALSHDARRVAFGETDKDGRHVDIWVRDLPNDTVTRLTFTPGLNELPVWSANDRSVVFTSNQKLHWDANRKNADGSGTEEKIAESERSANLAPWDCSHDGKYLLMSENGKFWYVSFPDSKSHTILDTNSIIENAQFSPDGRWVAYASNETGRWEVYVSPFPSPSSKWQVSRGGGKEPRWRRDGKELFYLSNDGKMMAVPMRVDAGFQSGMPVSLFQTHIRQPISATDMVSYDVTPDGQRFLVNTKVDEPNAEHLSVILNWAAAMDHTRD